VYIYHGTLQNSQAITTRLDGDHTTNVSMATVEQHITLANEAGPSITIPEIRLSIPAHAKEYNVHRTILSRRMRGTTRVELYKHPQRRANVKEDWLVQKIKETDERGYPASHARVEMAI
jgi:hypothetical protein